MIICPMRTFDFLRHTQSSLTAADVTRRGQHHVWLLNMSEHGFILTNAVTDSYGHVPYLTFS